jgi:hypothetical protein
MFCLVTNLVIRIRVRWRLGLTQAYHTRRYSASFTAAGSPWVLTGSVQLTSQLVLLRHVGTNLDASVPTARSNNENLLFLRLSRICWDVLTHALLQHVTRRLSANTSLPSTDTTGPWCLSASIDEADCIAFCCCCCTHARTNARCACQSNVLFTRRNHKVQLLRTT